MVERGRFRVEDEPDLVKRDGCLAVLGFLFLFWGAVVGYFLAKSWGWL